MSRRFKPTTYNRGRRARTTQINRQARRQAAVRGARAFVPRTMGPFATTESKYFDSFLDGGTIAESTDWTATEIDPATLNTLVVPSEGSDIDNRIGRKIAVYRLSIRGFIRCTTSVDQADILRVPAVRLILYMDTQTNGTQAQGEQLMAAPGAATTALCTATFMNLANLGRFRILRDKTYRMPTLVAAPDNAGTTQFTSTQGHADMPFKINIKFRKPVVINFNSTNGGSVGDIVDNSFHLLANKTGANFVHTISYQCRAAYKDH